MSTLEVQPLQRLAWDKGETRETAYVVIFEEWCFYKRPKLNRQKLIIFVVRMVSFNFYPTGGDPSYREAVARFIFTLNFVKVVSFNHLRFSFCFIPVNICSLQCNVCDIE